MIGQYIKEGEVETIRYKIPLLKVRTFKLSIDLAKLI